MKKLFILGLLTVAISGLQLVNAEDCSDINNGAREVSVAVPAVDTDTVEESADSE